MNMDQIMGASFQEPSNDIRVVFKKTVLVKQYETEVIEMESTVHLDGPVTGAERMFIAALIHAQLEYMACTSLVVKGLLTQSELTARKVQLESEVKAIMLKGEAVTGKKFDKYLGCIESTEQV